MKFVWNLSHTLKCCQAGVLRGEKARFQLSVPNDPSATICAAALTFALLFADLVTQVRKDFPNHIEVMCVSMFLKEEYSHFPGIPVNTAARMESNGERGKIHVSQQTADLLFQHGRAHWVHVRDDKVHAKGKGKTSSRRICIVRTPV